MSFQNYTLRTFINGKAPWVGLQNYVTVVTDELFTKALVNTALFTVGSIVGQFVIGMLLALFFHKNFPLNGVLRALFLLPWLLPLIVGSAAWRAILEQDSGILNVTLEEPRDHRRTDPVAHLAGRGVDRDHPGEHLAGHPVQPDPALQRAAGHPGRALRGGCAGRRDRVEGVLEHHLARTCALWSASLLDAGRDLHAEGARHHPGPDPGRSGQRDPDHRHCMSYQRSFVEFKFGQGAALSNILILISLVFAIVYLRATRRQVDE